jgi:hypothetical protein
MTPSQFENQMFTVIMALYNLHRDTGLSHTEASIKTADFLLETSNSLRNLPERENIEQSS